jgi:virginiamycin B lyase
MNFPARRILFAMLALAISACATATPAPQYEIPPQTQPTPEPQAGPLVVGPHSPYAITIGPDNNVWFTEYQGDSIGMMTPAGDVTRFPLAPDGIAERLTAGPDNALWFTDPKGNRIGRIAIDGKTNYMELPNAECGPAGITTGADGFIYFTEHAANRIGRMNADGVLTEFTLRKKSGPAEIVTGHDGMVYFIEDEAGRIGRINKDGKIREFTIPTEHSVPAMIASGPDASIYFTELHAGKIGKLKLSGAFDEYLIPHGTPLGLAAGADGNLWATIPRDHLIYRMTSGGDFSGYRAMDRTSPAFITAAPDGYLYFSEPSGRIGRINAEGDITEFEVGK